MSGEGKIVESEAMMMRKQPHRVSERHKNVDFSRFMIFSGRLSLHFVRSFFIFRPITFY